MDIRLKNTLIISWNMSKSRDALEELINFAKQNTQGGREGSRRCGDLRQQKNGQENNSKAKELYKHIVVLIQEVPYRVKTILKCYGWTYFSNEERNLTTPHCGIAIYPEVEVEDVSDCNSAIRVNLKTNAGTLDLISVYLTKQTPIAEQISELQVITNLCGEMYIFGGDFNARSQLWGDTLENSRGKCIKNWISEQSVCILPRPSSPSFEQLRGNNLFESTIDFICASLTIASENFEHIELEDLVLSDHYPIAYNVSKTLPNCSRTFTTRKYAKHQPTYDLFAKRLEWKLTTEEMAQASTSVAMVERISRAVEETATKTLRRTKAPEKRIKQVWWTSDLDELRWTVMKLRRRLKSGSINSQICRRRLYKKVVEVYKSKIEKAKKEYWNQKLKAIEPATVWDEFYHRYTKKSIENSKKIFIVNDAGQKIECRQMILNMLAEKFFPEDDQSQDEEQHRLLRLKTYEDGCRRYPEEHEETDKQFSMSHLDRGIAALAKGKVPGEDGITNEMISAMLYGTKCELLKLYNKCLKDGNFPADWKIAVIKFLRKPGVEQSSLKSFRPIGLLSTIGKLFEKLIFERIFKSRQKNLSGDIAKRQYGFTPGVSAEDALDDLVNFIYLQEDKGNKVTLVSLDIASAFDSAWWPLILARLRKIKVDPAIYKVMESYLSCRKVKLYLQDEFIVKEQAKGCVQGSVLGPLLWNLIVDELFEYLEGTGIRYQAYADDVALVSSGKTYKICGEKIQCALKRVEKWLKRSKLTVSVEKSLALAFKSQKKSLTTPLVLCEKVINYVSSLKILGVHIDKDLTWIHHFKIQVEKTRKLSHRLLPLVLKNFGPKAECVRLLYEGVIVPKITYASRVIEKGLKYKTVQKLLDKTQRMWLVKAYRLYCSTSKLKTLAASSTPDIKETIREKSELHHIRRTGIWQRGVFDRVEVDVKRFWPEIESKIVEESRELTTRLTPSTSQLSTYSAYTDGSKIDGKVGAAYVLFSNSEIVKIKRIKLDDNCSVFQAEALAIKTLLDDIVNNPEIPSIKVLTDSLSVLKSLWNHKKCTRLVNELKFTLQQLKCNGKVVHLKWIKGHAGDVGNEKADEEAKAAALQESSPSYLKIPLSTVKSMLRARSFQRLDKELRENSPRVMDLLSSSAWNSAIYSKSFSKEMLWFITEHSPCKSHLKKIGISVEEDCPCGFIIQDLKHILICPLLVPIWASRGDIWECLKNKQKVCEWYFKNQVETDILLRRAFERVKYINRVNVTATETEADS